MIIIVGGGASGLMCAAAIDLNTIGEQGIILEGTSRLGTKLLMSGGGHCNITHDGSIKDFLLCYGAAGKKIRRLLYRHSNVELREWLDAEGVPTEVDEGGRVLPRSMRAADVLSALVRRCRANGWELVTDCRVSAIGHSEEGYSLEAEDGRTYSCDTLVLACGGITYPRTGSDGSMHRILRRDLGVSITELKPALLPVRVEAYPYEELAGLTLGDVTLTVRRHGRKDESFRGGLLMAHNEFTGPAALAASGSCEAGCELNINYVAASGIRTPEEVQRLLEARGKKSIATAISEELGLPRRLSKAIADRSGDSPVRAARMVVADSFKVAASSGDLSRAMVTAGGVAMEKSVIDYATLELRSHPGCHVIGELLDIDAVTGGYNLQFCYSSARAVADAIVEPPKA